MWNFEKHVSYTWIAEHVTVKGGPLKRNPHFPSYLSQVFKSFQIQDLWQLLWSSMLWSYRYLLTLLFLNTLDQTFHCNPHLPFPFLLHTAQQDQWKATRATTSTQSPCVQLFSTVEDNQFSGLASCSLISTSLMCCLNNEKTKEFTIDLLKENYNPSHIWLYKHIFYTLYLYKLYVT
jgi:hypothetical protein